MEINSWSWNSEHTSSDFGSIKPSSKSQVGRIEFVSTFDCHNKGLLWIRINTTITEMVKKGQNFLTG